MKVTIENKHLQVGEPGSCARCPVALAINEAAHGGRALVDGAEIDFDGRFFPIPNEVQDFIDRVDAHDVSGARSMLPLTFEMAGL